AHSVAAPTPTVVSVLSLHDALPISVLGGGEATPTGVEVGGVMGASARPDRDVQGRRDDDAEQADGDCTAAVTDSVRLGGELLDRSEEHTSELQSRFDLVCRLLLEKK